VDAIAYTTKVEALSPGVYQLRVTPDFELAHVKNEENNLVEKWKRSARDVCKGEFVTEQPGPLLEVGVTSPNTRSTRSHPSVGLTGVIGTIRCNGGT
jgi:hypothetical protein